jgi:hypothetical protein
MSIATLAKSVAKKIAPNALLYKQREQWVRELGEAVAKIKRGEEIAKEIAALTNRKAQMISPQELHNSAPKSPEVLALFEEWQRCWRAIHERQLIENNLRENMPPEIEAADTRVRRKMRGRAAGEREIEEDIDRTERYREQADIRNGERKKDPPNMQSPKESLKPFDRKIVALREELREYRADTSALSQQRTAIAVRWDEVWPEV